MRVLYDEWAGEHDQVLQAFGYSYLPVIAGLVARYVRELDAPILDATGIVGEVLSILGYTRLTGIDLSDGMLAVARAKAAYAKLNNETLGERLDYADDAFAAVVSAGVLTTGHAPPSCFDELIRITRPGGHLIFSLSLPVYEEGGCRPKLKALSAAGRWRTLETTPICCASWRARLRRPRCWPVRTCTRLSSGDPTMAQPIDFYFDFASPYGYLASTQIEALAERHGRTVAWHPIMLGAAFKETGARPLMQTPLKGPYLLHDVPRFARLLGVPLTLPPVMPMNSLAASRACVWIEEENPAQAKALAEALFAAHWAEGRDLGAPEAVADVAAGLGIEREALLAAIADQRIKDRLKEQTQAAIERGVFGSPFIFVDVEPFWGADRLAQVDTWLTRGGW